jgi:hypothetical protein
VQINIGADRDRSSVINGHSAEQRDNTILYLSLAHKLISRALLWYICFLNALFVLRMTMREIGMWLSISQWNLFVVCVRKVVVRWFGNFILKFSSLLNALRMWNISRGSCWSPVGRTEYATQEVSLGADCWYKGIILHELMHAVGFWHEMNRPDRDSFIQVYWENIMQVNMMSEENNTILFKSFLLF